MSSVINKPGKHLRVFELRYQAAIAEWQEFYEKYFDLSIDPPGLINGSSKIFNYPQVHYRRLLPVAPGLSVLNVIDVSQNFFDVWVGPNRIELRHISDERSAGRKPYNVWTREGVEANSEYQNRSIDWLRNEKISSQTLLERLLHGLKYWDERQRHLDREGCTLCAGSQFSDGTYPVVQYFEGKVLIRKSWFKSNQTPPHVSVRSIC